MKANNKYIPHLISSVGIYVRNPTQVINYKFDPIEFCKPEDDVYNETGFLVRNDRWYDQLDLPDNFKPNELKELKEFMQKYY